MAAAVLLFAVAGCRRPANEGGILVDASVAPLPVRAGIETISFRLTDASRQPVAGARVQVEGDMSHPGMAPVFSNAVEISPGAYTAPLHFTMGGDWVVLFHIALNDGRTAERQIEVKGVESN
jgi:hypothetical protein